MKKLFALFTMCFLGVGLTSACFVVDVVDVDECSSSTFDEYCTSYGEAVQCIGGEIVTSYCGSGYTCAEYIGLPNTAECVPDVIPCNPSTFDEYCVGDTPVWCIDGIEQYAGACTSGYTCVEYDEYNDRAECVPDIIPCNPNSFDEYCVGDTPVWCIDGIEQYANTCTGGSTCVEFKKGYDTADCVIPDYDEYGGDICEYDDLYYGVTLTRCYDGIKYFYECSETNTSYDYWRPVDSYSCSYGCDADGVDCY